MQASQPLQISFVRPATFYIKIVPGCALSFQLMNVTTAVRKGNTRVGIASIVNVKTYNTTLVLDQVSFWS